MSAFALTLAAVSLQSTLRLTVNHGRRVVRDGQRTAIPRAGEEDRHRVLRIRRRRRR